MKRNIILTLLFALCVVAMQGKTRKAIFVIVDGVPADCVERLQPPTLSAIAREGGFSRAYCGGEIGSSTETITISAVGYTNVLTGTWVNKHNVKGNGGIKANYNYPTLFRIAKDQKRPLTTAIYSSWLDNRTELLGEGRAETRNLKVDYIFDGYENDTKAFPHKDGDLHIRDIDGHVCDEAAKCIKENAPDLNWVYMWYTDDAFHQRGYGKFTDEALMNADRQLKAVWDAVKYREKNFDEEWLVIITTDHGRSFDGHGHGGQSELERTIWMVTNQKKLNKQWGRKTLSHVDICPTICRFMDFDVPRDVAFEQEGIPFIGPTDIFGLKAKTYDDQLLLTWDHQGKRSMAKIYIATTNNFATGGKDNWIEVGEVPAASGRASIDMSKYKSEFLKVVVATPFTTLTRWIRY